MADENTSVATAPAGDSQGTQTAVVETPVDNSNNQVDNTNQQTQTDNTQNQTQTQEAPVESNRARYDALMEKFNANPNMKLSKEEASFLNDLNDGKLSLEEVEAKADGEVTEEGTEQVTTEEADPEVAELDKGFDELMQLMGVEDFKTLPNRIKETTQRFVQEKNELTNKVSTLESRDAENQGIFKSMEQLMLGIRKGDPAAIARFDAIQAQRGQQAPQTQTQPQNQRNFKTEDLADPEAFTYVDSKIAQLEAKLGEYEQERIQRQHQEAEQKAITEARSSVMDEMTGLVEKFPAYGLKPATVRAGLKSFFETGVVNDEIKPLVGLLNFTIDYNKTNKTQINLEVAHVLQHAKGEPQRAAEAVKKEVKKVFDVKKTQNTLAGENSKTKSVGNQTPFQKLVEKMQKNPGVKLTDEEYRLFEKGA